MMATITKRKWTAEGITKEAWQVRHEDASGGWKRRQFASKRDAFAFVRELEEQAAAAEAPKRFIDLCEEYLRLARQRHDDGRLGYVRLRTLTSSFRDKVRPFFGERLADAITSEDVGAYHNKLLRGGTLNQQSARVQIELLLLVETQANKHGLMMSRPVTAAMNELRPTAREQIRTFKADEVRHLIDFARRRQPGAHLMPAARLQCFVNTAAFCGLRRGEIGALTIDSVRFDERLIEVRHSLTADRKLKGPKTKSGLRDVPMPPLVAKLLRDWIARHYRANPQRLLFTGRGGRPLDIDLIHPVWHDLLDRAGLSHDDRPFHFHALRHFYASMMIEAGTPLADTAILLGHSSFDETLQTYAHSVIRAPARRSFVDRMVDRFDAPKAPSHAARSRQARQALPAPDGAASTGEI